MLRFELYFPETTKHLIKTENATQQKAQSSQ